MYDRIDHPPHHLPHGPPFPRPKMLKLTLLRSHIRLWAISDRMSNLLCDHIYMIQSYIY